MKNLYWLVRREIWEYKTEMVWAPIALSGLFVLLIFCATLSNVLGISGGLFINGKEITAALFENASRAKDITVLIEIAFFTLAFIQFAMTGFVVFSYLTNCLLGERKDRSVLFWKSLPVSDRDTVLSKVFTALVVAPVISMVTAITAFILVSLMVGLSLGSVSAVTLLMGGVFELALRSVLSLPIQILWAIPTVGWCLLVSSYVRSNASLWSFGVPLIGYLFWYAIAAAKDVEVNEVFALPFFRLFMGTIPLSWVTFQTGGEAFDGSGYWSYIGHAWSVVSRLGVWLGVLIGSAMIYASLLLRQRVSGD